MIDSAVIVLPEPDSPTMPRHSPGATDSDTPSIACTVARRSRISVCRSWMSRSGANESPPKRNQRRCRRTSNESRSASPMKLIAMTTRMIAMPAGKICHQ